VIVMRPKWTDRSSSIASAISTRSPNLKKRVAGSPVLPAFLRSRKVPGVCRIPCIPGPEIRYRFQSRWIVPSGQAPYFLVAAWHKITERTTHVPPHSAAPTRLRLMRTRLNRPGNLPSRQQLPIPIRSQRQGEKIVDGRSPAQKAQTPSYTRYGRRREDSHTIPEHPLS